ncbi:MAG: hypothetical protein RLZZ369_795, partial [Pseudomonadota bacterium]
MISTWRRMRESSGFLPSVCSIVL